MKLRLAALATLLFALHCGSDDKKPAGTCTMDEVGTTGSCGDGMVCEEVTGGAPTCFAAVNVEGRIFDSADDSGIEGASIVALDANGSALSSVVFSGADGEYSLPVPVPRKGDGTPSDLAVTLRVAADGYQSFPTPPRTALPIQLADAVQGKADPNAKKDAPPPPYVVMNAATDVALIALVDQSGEGIIKGHVDFADAGGVLIVAEVNGMAVSTAITDADGNFTIFNLPPGDVTLSGFRSGVAVDSQTVTATSGTVDKIVLSASAKGLSTVTGSVQIVDPGDCKDTSVILVVESTFIENAARGEAPAGLRAGNVTGEFSIEGVPPGRYVVLAAFENDSCVRDPDPCIAGTDILHISVPEEAAITDAFKVTGALAVISPGANGIEVISDANPTFQWQDDSSEEGYELRVYDAFGTLVHEDLNVPSAKGKDPSYQLTGVNLEPGMIYQFRTWSWRKAERCLISSTEDLKGVFLYQP